MRKEFELTDEQFNEILKINKEGSDRVMYISGGQPLGSGSGGSFMSLQEKINAYWEKLGAELGFDWETIQGITDRKFSAEIREDNP